MTPMTNSLRFALLGLLSLLLCCGKGDDPAPPSVEPPTPRGPLDDVLRINHIQAKSTHNSYHIETPGNAVPEWKYTHAPLDQQLGEQGVRGFEIDTHFVPGDTPEQHRFDVFHLKLIDEKTTCGRLVECLQVLRGWSDRHRGHHPIFVMFEPKDDLPSTAPPEEIFATFEREILAAWPRERIITPDDIKGDAPTLREAVTSRGWPTLGQSRGKILFFLNNTEKFRQNYTRNLANLDGRLMFVESSPDDPFAAVLILNNPVSSAAQIDAGLKAGFLVRTFADSASSPDPAERDAALASGAHLLSSDLPVPVQPGGYSLQIPQGTPSRCNPKTAPPECTSEAIEGPDLVPPGR